MVWVDWGVMGRWFLSVVVAVVTVLALAVAAFVGVAALDGELISADSTGQATNSGTTANVVIEVSRTGDTAPAGSSFNLNWTCRVSQTDFTQTASGGEVPFTGTQLVIGDRPIGEVCAASMNALGDDSRFWKITNSGAVTVTDTVTVIVPVTADYTDPLQFAPSYVDINVVVNSPGIDPPSAQIYIECDSEIYPFDDVFDDPSDWADGDVLLTLYPDKQTSTCDIQVAFDNGDDPYWDQRVEGKCGDAASVAIISGETSTVTFTQTYVEPYVKRCPYIYESE
jgi:Domain of unknown function (DUF5979)